MHLYCLARGEKDAIRKWENDLSAVYLPMETKTNGKKDKLSLAQLQVRPVNLYEIVFPEEHEAIVMGMLKPTITGEGFLGKHWLINVTKFFRKILGLKKPLTEYKPKLLPVNAGVCCFALGTKKDVLNWTIKPDANSGIKDGNEVRENL